MTTTNQPTCNCEAQSSIFPGNPWIEHERTCPVWEPPLTNDEIRRLRELLAEQQRQLTMRRQRVNNLAEFFVGPLAGA
jgi:hypothetical protein